MHRLFLFWLLFVIKKLSQNNILLTTIKFKTFQDYSVKFKDFKALNLVQSNSRLLKTILFVKFKNFKALNLVQSNGCKWFPYPPPRMFGTAMTPPRWFMKTMRLILKVGVIEMLNPPYPYSSTG